MRYRQKQRSMPLQFSTAAQSFQRGSPAAASLACGLFSLRNASTIPQHSPYTLWLISLHRAPATKPAQLHSDRRLRFSCLLSWFPRLERHWNSKKKKKGETQTGVETKLWHVLFSHDNGNTLFRTMKNSHVDLAWSWLPVVERLSFRTTTARPRLLITCLGWYGHVFPASKVRF